MKFMKLFLFLIHKRLINYPNKKMKLFKIFFMRKAKENIILIIIYQISIRFMMKNLIQFKGISNKLITIVLLLKMQLSFLKLSLKRKPSLKLLMNLKKKERLENTSVIPKSKSSLRKLQNRDRLSIKTWSTVTTESKILRLVGDSVSFSWRPSL